MNLKLTRRKIFMRSIFKILMAAILMFPVLSYSQKDSTKLSPHHFNRIQLSLGLSYDMALGDGFLNDAYDLQVGSDLTADFYLDSHWYIGSRFKMINTEVIKPEKTEGISATSIFSFGLQGGYAFKFNDRLYLDLIGGIGPTTYNHDSKFGTKFRDSATTLWVGPKMSYRINNFFGIYGGLEFRNDFMNTSVPAELENYYGDASIFSLSAGMRFITH